MTSPNRSAAHVRCLALALATLANVSCTSTSHDLSPAQSAAVADSVRAALATYQRYAAAAQWDSLVSLYSTDSSFRWIEGGQRYHGGRVRQSLMGMPRDVHVETTYDSAEVTVLAPGLALLTTYYQTRFVGPTSAHFGGAISMVWAHQPGGWRLIGGHSSSETPHTTP